jgi:hypothetical protein
MLTARSQDQLASRLQARLESRSCPVEYAHELTRAFTELYAEAESPPAPDGVFPALIRNYAIRKDDLKLFDAATDSLAAAAGAQFFLGAEPTIGAKVAIAIAVFKFMRNMMTRGVWLEQDQIWLLTILRCNVHGPNTPGLTVEEILEVINRRTPLRNIDWVDGHLKRLTAVPTLSGANVAALVSCDDLGRWRSHA